MIGKEFGEKADHLLDVFKNCPDTRSRRLDRSEQSDQGVADMSIVPRRKSGEIKSVRSSSTSEIVRECSGHREQGPCLAVRFAKMELYGTDRPAKLNDVSMRPLKGADRAVFVLATIELTSDAYRL